MRKKDTFKISREVRDEMIASIQNYFEKEREEELGSLAAGMILDFFMEELAPEFYNQGVTDSYRFMNAKCEDLMAIMK